MGVSPVGKGWALPGWRNVGDPATPTFGDLLSLRRQGQWFIWGAREYSANNTGAENAAGAGPNFPAGAPAGGMIALPNFFPEKGTITKLAVGFTNDLGGENNWVGLAADTIGADHEHYPGDTIIGSGVHCIGGATGLRKLRGGDVSIPTPGGTQFWAVFQSARNNGAGVVWVGIDAGAYPMMGGMDILSGLVSGSTLPGAGFTTQSSIGFQTPIGTIPAYSFERNFPAAASTTLLRAANDAAAQANHYFVAIIPMILFQWTRT